MNLKLNTNYNCFLCMAVLQRGLAAAFSIDIPICVILAELTGYK